MMPQSMSFEDAIRIRHSTRGFLSKPVPDDLIQEVLEDAQCTPSNCNTQPWDVHIISGAKREEMSAALHRAFETRNYTPDFSFDDNEYTGRYKERYGEMGQKFYGALNVARDDVVGRTAAAARNLSFYGAPHVAFLFMPTFGDSVRVAGDIGMYGQTFLLSLFAHGLAGVPQTMLGFFAGTVREVLKLSEERKLLFGISFGYRDGEAPANSFRVGRDPIADCVTFYS